MSSSFLSSDFLAQYEGKRPKNAGVLFEVTHLNKYSWWLEDKRRRETWTETVKRVVDYSISLYQGPTSEALLKEEAELMFHKMWCLEAMPAGRTMRIGGTPACYKFPEMNFNCSYTTVKDIRSLVDSFHMSLCSVGLGYRVLFEDIETIEGFCPTVIVEHEEYNNVPNGAEHTICEGIWLGSKLNTYRLTIGDSKEAWIEALETFLINTHVTSFESDTIKWVINYDNIRKEGSRIKTAGGYAAGYEGMKEMFTRLADTITTKKGKLTPVAAMDSQNIVGKNVVTGGNRRSAQIALGSPDDEEFISAKLNLYTKMPDGKWKVPPELEHRKMSNNSVVFTSKPSKEKLEAIFENIKNNGEPGFFNLEAARKRRPNCEGLNPCAEILLDDKGVCNLSTVIMTSHLHSYYPDDPKLSHKLVFDETKLEKSVRLATRIGMRQTNVTLSLPEWDKVQKRDRLTGVSFTGWEDALDLIIKSNDGCFSDRDIWVESYGKKILAKMNRWANDEATNYAYEMRIPRPLLVTAIKPEGTISLLPTVSWGLHRSYAPYYIRRVSVTKTDPLNKALKEIGVPWEVDQRQAESTREIFLFPIKTNSDESAYDEPAVAQLNRYFMMQKNYTDHNSSCTIYVGSGYDGYEDEWDQVIDLIYERWDEMIAVSFLPKHSLSNPPFPQMPNEACTKETYEELSNLGFMDKLFELYSIVTKYEQEKTEYYEIDAACAGGVCPTA